MNPSASSEHNLSANCRALLDSQVDSQTQERGSLDGPKDLGLWIFPIQKKHNGSKDLWRAVIFAIGVIFWYSWGAIESLARKGETLMYDTVNALHITDKPVSSVQKIDPRSLEWQFIALQKQNKDLADQNAHLSKAVVLSTVNPSNLIPVKPVVTSQSDAPLKPKKIIVHREKQILPNDMVNRKVVNILGEKPISYGALKGMTQTVQTDLNIPGMEIRMQEQSGGKYKIWVTRNGRSSRGFYASTPKHRDRLTEAGMRQWAMEKVEYLTHLETIETIAVANSISLAKNRMPTRTAGAPRFSLKVSEAEKKGKVRFLLSSMVDGKVVPYTTVDFTTKADINEASLTHDFTVTKSRSLVLLAMKR